jgi:endothelin-converting enzyme/putative endopeptidase
MVGSTPLRGEDMRLRIITATLAIAAACKTAEPLPETPKASAPPSAATAPAPAPAQATAQKPMPPGLDEGAMDASVSPCDDFYQYACGGWLKTVEIPADKPRWSRGFESISERNVQRLRTILDGVAAGNVPEGTPYAQQLGDFYGACTDEARIEQSSLDQLRAELARLDVKTPKAVAATLGRLHALDVPVVFRLDAVQDFKDATSVIAYFDQSGLGLPDRDYYLSDDAKKKAVRELYQQHAQNMFTLLGQPAEQAKASAATVLELETRLAKASISRVERRSPEKIYHPTDAKGLKAAAPGFAWDEYLKAVKAPALGKVNVTHPPFFAEAAKLVQTVPAKDWTTYLTWHVVRASAPALPKRFQEEVFAFSSKALSGAKEDLPRWKKCVRFTDAALGEALAVPFIAQTFGAEGKAKAQQLVTDIELAFERNLDTLDWMDAPTKAGALTKVRKIVNKIGYPEKWRSYDGLKVDRASFFTSALNAAAFEKARQLAKIGKPLDRAEWGLTPPTVNAYYDPSMNEIVFPAGILQTPFFNRDASIPVNFGAMGMVVGHEFTHGFDDEGSQFDAEGNLKTWWTEEARKLFMEKVGCVKNQFDSYVAVDDIRVNGQLTLGENVADLGGLKLTHAAALAWAEKHPEEADKYRFNPSQQVFLGFAQSWCAKTRPEFARVLAQVDPHSPAFLRVNGPLRNLDSFRQAFNCPAGAKMVRPPAEACQVW